jgi:hypothetical protein
MKTRKPTKRIHYVTNAVGSEHRTFDTVEEAKLYAASKKTLLSVAKDKYQVMAALVKRLYNA